MPGETPTGVLEATGLPSAVMTQAAKGDFATAVPVTPAVIGSEQSAPNASTSSGLIPGHADFTKYVVTSFNNTAGGSS